MKQYTGTKTVNAKPMNRLEYNQFRGWTLPQDENGEDEGFLVEYLDGGKANTSEYEGYVSWSPKEVFEKAYKPSATYIDRLETELNDLAYKRAKLDAYLDADNSIIPEDSFTLLKIQSGIMKSYEEILKHRLYVSVKNGKFKKVSNEPEYHRDISTDK